MGALVVHAAAVIDEVGLGALRQAQVLVGFLLDLGQFGADFVEIVSRLWLGAVGRLVRLIGDFEEIVGLH